MSFQTTFPTTVTRSCTRFNCCCPGGGDHCRTYGVTFGFETPGPVALTRANAVADVNAPFKASNPYVTSVAEGDAVVRRLFGPGPY